MFHLLSGMHIKLNVVKSQRFPKKEEALLKLTSAMQQAILATVCEVSAATTPSTMTRLYIELKGWAIFSIESIRTKARRRRAAKFQNNSVKKTWNS